MHEIFLQRIAAHPSLRNDVNFEVFLEYDQDVRIHSWITIVLCILQ
jgi:sorting nexin-5/6/32